MVGKWTRTATAWKSNGNGKETARYCPSRCMDGKRELFLTPTIRIFKVENIQGRVTVIIIIFMYLVSVEGVCTRPMLPYNIFFT